MTTETNAALVRRLARLLNEELKPRDIAYVLLVGIPAEDMASTHVGISSNVDPLSAATMMTKAVEGLANKPNIQLVDADGRQEGHA